MTITLYYIQASAPCRAVEMTAQHLGIKLEKKFVDLFNGEQMKPEFLAINPQHCVPTIDDNGFHLWESRAIMAYLVNKYAPENSLYPKDPKQRAIVDRMLNFDLGTLFKGFGDYIRSIIFGNQPPDAEKEEVLKKALEVFEKILEKTTYAAGNHITIADYSIMSYLVFAEEINPQHCVPAVDDNGFHLWESRAIMTYLVNKYAPESSLYPKDPKQRAIVDKILYFDIGTLFKGFMEYIRPIVLGGQPPDIEKEEVFKKGLEAFEKILESTTYAAGNHLTIADYSILSYLVFGEEMINYSYKEYSKISEWLEKLKKEIPRYKEINEIPIREFKEHLKSKK